MEMEWLSGRELEEVPCNVVKLANYKDSQNNVNDAPCACSIIAGGRNVFCKAVKLILIAPRPGKQQLK